jgi:tripartite-type tricarboxylate transporter receptor subunit TctC
MALRRAFESALKDPEFISEAAKMQLEIEPLTGDQIDKLLAKAYGSPKAIVQRAVELLEPLGRR